MTRYYEGSPDRYGNPAPAPGSPAMAQWLVRNPRQIDLVNTTDNSPAPFLDDGCRLDQRGSVVEQSEGQHRQLLRRSSRRARVDEGFKGAHLFVAREEVLPAFPGDAMHTGEGGWIQFADDRYEGLIEASLEAREKKIARAREHGASELEKLRVSPNPQGDAIGQLTAALAKAVSDGKTGPDAALQAELKATQAKLEEAQAALAESAKPPPAGRPPEAPAKKGGGKKGGGS